MPRDPLSSLFLTLFAPSITHSTSQPHQTHRAKWKSRRKRSSPKSTSSSRSRRTKSYRSSWTESSMSRWRCTGMQSRPSNAMRCRSRRASESKQCGCCHLILSSLPLCVSHFPRLPLDFSLFFCRAIADPRFCSYFCTGFWNLIFS